MSFDVQVFMTSSEDEVVEKVKKYIEKNPTKLNGLKKYIKWDKKGGDIFYEGTLLHFSCLWNNHPKVVSYLLSKNANVTKCFYDLKWKEGDEKRGGGELDGLTAKQIAEKKGFGNVASLFELSYLTSSRDKLHKVSNPSLDEVEEKSDSAVQPKPPSPLVKKITRKKTSNPQPVLHSTIKAKVLHNGNKAALNLTVSNLSDLQEQIKNKLNIIGNFRIEYLDKDFGEFVELHEITELKDLVELQIFPDKENNLEKISHFDNIPSRVTDVANEPSEILNPIIGLLDIPLCSFDETLQSLEAHVPGIENFSLICTMFANNIDTNKKQNLTDDEISSINLYTRESNPREKSVNFVVNKALRDLDRMTLKPFFPYLHLLLHSMCKLPKCPPGAVIWCGVPTNISSNYKKGKKIIWWGLSSCTKNMEALKSFLGQHNERTLFHVQINSAIEISQFSSCPKEEEVLVFPCVTFEVQSVLSPSKGLWIVQLKEIFSPGKLITGFELLGM